MSIKLRSGSQWKNVNKAYLKSGGAWKTITKAYIRSGGVWKSIFGFLAPSNEPSIAQTVTLTTNSSSMPAILTGRNYRWTNATVLEYKFQYNNGSQWLDGNGSNATGTITNPSVGSSNPKTYTPVIGDFPSSSATSTGSFRFVVTATNTNVSPTLQTVSTSDTVSVENVITITPVIPTISMGSNSGISQTAGTINWTSTNQASFSSTGTFSGTGTTGTSISKTGLTAGTTYTGTVTVTSSTGNTASANYSLTTSALVAAPVNQIAPALSISSNNNMSVTSGSWTNSPTSYRYRWYQVDPQPTTLLRDVTTTSTSDSFAGTYLREYYVAVTAINSGGSNTADSDSLYLEPPVVQYTITWNANGGTVTPTLDTVNAGQSVTAPTPTRSGYTFSHWRNPVSGDLMYIYYAGDVFTPTESFTLYAIWTAAVVVPTGGSVSLTGSSTPGSVITASTSGWAGSPTQYSVVIRTSLSTPTESSTIVAFSVGGASECQYTITTWDAVSPPNIFKAFATATNSAGTSAVVSSGTITATPASSTPPAAPPTEPPTPPAEPPTPPAAPPTPPAAPPVSETWYCSVSEDEPGVGLSQYQIIRPSDETRCSTTFAIACSQSGYPSYPAFC
jgi:hypothetical protein